MENRMRVLIGCEESGVVRRAFKALGCDAWSCDIKPARDNSPYHFQCDVRSLFNQHWDLGIFHPDCTDIAVCGAKYFSTKRADGRQQKAVDFFMECINAPIEKICVENPICIMSTIYKKPDQIIQPWMFGHGETKATCLWLKNIPKLTPTAIVEGREQRIWKMPPSATRARDRSETYQGIANAMAKQWTIG